MFSARQTLIILAAVCIPSMALHAQVAAPAPSPTPTTAPARADGPGQAPPGADEPLKNGEGRMVATTLADEILRFFPIPEQAKAYAAMLDSNASSGRYDNGTRGSLAGTLTSDLMAVHRDGHLKVFATDPAEKNAPPAPPQNLPPAIQSAKWMAPGIAYIRPSAFLQKDDEIQAFRDFMEQHRDAKTIIFDLRNDHGGGNAEPDVVFSYLFGKKTPLTRLEMARATFDQSGWPFPVTPTMEVSKGAAVVTGTRYALPGEDTPLRKAAVFILVSNKTASAAEGFADSLQSTHRGTLIGEATAGADHFGGPRPINDDFGVWMPVGRTYDVKTGKDWEGDGIAPDIAADPKQALVVALEKAGLSHAEAVRLDAEEIPAEPVHADKVRAR